MNIDFTSNTESKMHLTSSLLFFKYTLMRHALLSKANVSSVKLFFCLTLILSKVKHLFNHVS